MNYKPNELAIVTRSEPNVDDYAAEVMRRLQGKIVKVISLHPDAVWAIETPIILNNIPGPLGPFGLGLPMQVTIHGIGDCYLTPLRGDPLVEERPESIVDEVPA